VKTVLTNSSATQLRTVELGLELELGHKFGMDNMRKEKNQRIPTDLMLRSMLDRAMDRAMMALIST
jgi:hypothetical protein